MILMMSAFWTWDVDRQGLLPFFLFVVYLPPGTVLIKNNIKKNVTVYCDFIQKDYIIRQNSDKNVAH